MARHLVKTASGRYAESTGQSDSTPTIKYTYPDNTVKPTGGPTGVGPEGDPQPGGPQDVNPREDGMSSKASFSGMGDAGAGRSDDKW